MSPLTRFPRIRSCRPSYFLRPPLSHSSTSLRSLFPVVDSCRRLRCTRRCLYRFSVSRAPRSRWTFVSSAFCVSAVLLPSVCRDGMPWRLPISVGMRWRFFVRFRSTVLVSFSMMCLKQFSFSLECGTKAMRITPLLSFSWVFDCRVPVGTWGQKFSLNRWFFRPYP